MVGTRHAVSDNKSKSGLGMPSPYIPEREQIRDRKAGLKRETENCGRCTQRPYHSPLTAHHSPLIRKGGGDYSLASGHIGSTSRSLPYRGGYGEGSYY